VNSPLLDALGAVGNVLDTPRRLLHQGVGYLGGNQRVAEGGDIGGELMTALGMNPSDSWAGTLGSAAFNTATDPMTYLGVGLAKRAAQPFLNSVTRSNARKMLPARRELPVFKDAEQLAMTGNGPFMRARQVGGNKFDASSLQDAAGRVAPGSENVGVYVRGNRPAAATRVGSGPEAVRHEVLHHLRRQGALPGAADSMAGGLMGSESPLLRGLGTIADESLSHMGEARSLGGRLQGLGKFLGNQNYLDQIGRESPLVAALWQRRVPVAALGAGALGAAGYYGMSGEE
jgi:hypothetical protein